MINKKVAVFVGIVAYTILIIIFASIASLIPTPELHKIAYSIHSIHAYLIEGFIKGNILITFLMTLSTVITSLHSDNDDSVDETMNDFERQHGNTFASATIGIGAAVIVIDVMTIIIMHFLAIYTFGYFNLLGLFAFIGSIPHIMQFKLFIQNKLSSSKIDMSFEGTLYSLFLSLAPIFILLWYLF